MVGGGYGLAGVWWREISCEKEGMGRGRMLAEMNWRKEGVCIWHSVAKNKS